jgi:hypothetical protein
MDEWRPVGTHLIRVEDDILYIRFIGDVSLADTKALTAVQEEILARHGHLFCITNLNEGGSFAPEGRKFLGAWNKKHSVAGVAQYGGSLVAQVMALLMLGAIRAFGGNVPEMKYVTNEEEGRAWVFAQRAKLGFTKP